MSRPALRVLFAPMLLSVCSLVFPAVTWAQAEDEPFRQGLQARGDRKWPEVVTQMRAAIAINGQEASRRVRSGGLGGVFGGGTEYMPYYLLGEAHFEQGECAAAVDAWAVSVRQGVVRQKTDFFENLERGYKTCAAKGILLPPQFEPLYDETNLAYADAAALADRVLKAGTANREVWQGDFENRYALGQKEIQAAYGRLLEARRSRLAADFKAARDAVDRGLGILRPVELGFNATVTNIAAVRAQAQRVEQSIQAADKIDQAIEAIKSALTPALQGARRDAQSRLGQARDRLSVARRTQSQSAAAEAAAHATAAGTSLTDVLARGEAIARDTLAERLRNATAAATQAFAFVDTSQATLDRLTTERPTAVKPELGGERDAVQKEIAALRRRLDRAIKAEDVGGIETTAGLAAEAAGRLDALITSFGPVTLRDRGIHAALEAGVRAFFAGEYQQALDALGPASTLTDVPLQHHVHLFRAAALFGVFAGSGETNRQLLDDALAEIERCRQLSPSFTPDPAYFSPRFITLYQEGASAPQAPAGAPSPSQ